MFTAKKFARRKYGSSANPESMHTRMSGGLMDTEVNELTVSPWGVPLGARSETIVIPVANCAHAFRKDSGSGGLGMGIQTLACVLAGAWRALGRLLTTV